MFNRKASAPSSTCPKVNDASLRKPKIGIALGAGAARGWSHIGVLQELLARGIAPQIVAGTSIGAVVGGLYAADRLAAIEDFARGLTKKRVFSFLDLSLSGIGLLAGAKLRKSLEAALGDATIEALPRRFAVVATEFGSGHEVWLRSGNLVDAIRASYALPGIFEPVSIDGQLLFDGALVNPVPVTVCRMLGADFVIAVNLIGDNAFRSPVFADALSLEREATASARNPRSRGIAPPDIEKTAPGIASIVLEAFNITQDRISRSRLAGDPPDVMIHARNTHIGLFDFHRADELITIGRDAARRSLHDIVEHLARAQRSAKPTAQAAP